MKGLTEKQRAWLERLRDEGPQKIVGRGRTGFTCRKMGLSCWLMERDGERLPAFEVERLFSSHAAAWNAGWRFVPGDIEAITEAGRQALQGSGE